MLQGAAEGEREVRLVVPTLEALPAYVEALERGWSPDNIRGAEATREELDEIRRDPAGFVARQVDREAKGPPVKLPDGARVARLPGYRLWMWDGGFCGSIGFRWQPGTSKLPAHVLGHIGYAVVPWRRREGHATRALGLMRERVRAEGLAYAEITSDADNVASCKVIMANGGVAVERFRKPATWSGRESLSFRWYTGEPHPIEPETERLRLRQWRDGDLAPFAALNADPGVMEHFPAPLSREESDALAARLRDAMASRGWGLWAVERRADDAFLGFAGLTPVRREMPFAPAVEIGWRLARAAWGSGYATEAARAALRVAFGTLELPEVVSFTAATNERSVAVMRRLGMREDAPFEHPAIAEGHRLRPHRLFRLSR